jgi:hypothetical protein
VAARGVVLVLFVLLAAAVRPAVAAGPFDASALKPLGGPPVEGEAYTYRLTLVAPTERTGEVAIHLPPAALFVALQGLDEAEFDHDARVVRWRGTIKAGVPRDVTLTLVAGIDSGGHTSSLHVTVRPWQGAVTYLVHSVEVDTRMPPTLFRLGNVGFNVATVAVLGWLAGMGLFWLVMRLARPRDANWAPIAIGLPAGFLLYFAALAWDDRRILALPETTCTVVDRVLDTRTSSSSTRPRSGPQTVYAPRLALAYSRGNGDAVAQGFGTDSRLSGARASGAQTILERYAIGSQVSCAIDSRDARRAYVERGFGGAYFFALIPLPLLLLGVWGLKRR